MSKRNSKASLFNIKRKLRNELQIIYYEERKSLKHTKSGVESWCMGEVLKAGTSAGIFHKKEFKRGSKV
ncbi:MAG: hypothetical protein GX811_07405 [Lentisphaerae bacterium]|nr:hypothetical protein [Lentisphaerota bacterium]